MCIRDRYGGDALENMLKTYCVSPAGRCWLHVTAVVGVGTGLAAFYRHTPASIRTGQVGREIQIGEVIAEWRAMRGVSRGAGTNC